MRSVAVVALAAALALPLAVYASIGAYSRYTADDFCWGGVLRTEGFLNSQVQWYTVYSPRYAFTLAVNLVELMGPAVVPVLPLAAILIWLVALTFCLTQFGVTRWYAVVLAEAAAVATLQTAPDLPQSLYWQTGMLTYLLPLILATFLVGWIRRGARAWWAVALCGAVTFVAGGLSETYLIPQNVVLTLCLIVAVALRHERSAHLASALAGGVLALMVIVISPSMEQRVGGPPADLWLALSASIATAAYQVLRLIRFFPFVIVLALGVPLLLGERCQWRLSRRWLVLASAVLVISLPFCYFPSFYAQNGNPPARSLIVPGAMLIAYLLLIGFALRNFAGERTRAHAAALGALALIPIGVAVTSFPEQANAARYAALFDAEDRQIRASRDAGQLDLTVPQLPANLGENFVSADRQDWFNKCVARYYGLRSIATAES